MKTKIKPFYSHTTVRAGKYFWLLSVLLIFTGCTPKHPAAADLTVVNSEGVEIEVTAKLAVSPGERRKGLGNIDAIEIDDGMLHIYGNDKYIKFTMKGARNDLSVAFMDSSGIIKEIFDMVIDPSAVYRPSTKCRYALQMAHGWFSDNNVVAGSRVLMPRDVAKIKPVY